MASPRNGRRKIWMAPRAGASFCRPLRELKVARETTPGAALTCLDLTRSLPLCGLRGPDAIDKLTIVDGDELRFVGQFAA